MIDRTEAEHLAKQRVDELASEAGDEFSLFTEATIQVESGWIFFFNSAEFLRTRDPSAQLAGNGPLFVSLDGVVILFPSSITWQESLAKLMRKNG